MRRILGLVIMSALASAALAQQGFGPLDIVKWSTLQSGQNSKIKASMTRVINNEAEFQTYWASAMGQSPNSAPRNVDWLKEQVLAVHLGERNTGAYSVRVSRIERVHAAELMVTYVESAPGKRELTPTVITSPWTLIRMERTAGNLRFQKQTEERRYPIVVGRGCGCCSACTCTPSWDSVGPVRGARLGEPVGWRMWDGGAYSGISDYRVTVMRMVSDLGTYWSAHSGSNHSPFDKDPVRWGQEQLVALNLGKMYLPGYELVIDSVSRVRPGEVLVNYTVIYPGQQVGLARQGSSPYAIFRMERTNDRLVFVRRNFLPDGSMGGCSCRCGRCRVH